MLNSVTSTFFLLGNMLNVYWYNYSMRTDWLLMINISILVKCTVNCTGALLTRPGGSVAYILVYIQSVFVD